MDVTTLSVLLLLGCAGFIGTWAAGRFLKGNVTPFLKLPALVIGGATVGLLLFGFSVAAAGFFMAIWGAMNTMFSVIWMTWMSQNADDAPEAASSLMVAAIQASILLAVLANALIGNGPALGEAGGDLTWARPRRSPGVDCWRQAPPALPCQSLCPRPPKPRKERLCGSD